MVRGCSLGYVVTTHVANGMSSCPLQRRNMHARPDQILSDGSECGVATYICWTVGHYSGACMCMYASHGNHSTV